MFSVYFPGAEKAGPFPIVFPPRITCKLIQLDISIRASLQNIVQTFLKAPAIPHRLSTFLLLLTYLRPSVMTQWRNPHPTRTEIPYGFPYASRLLQIPSSCLLVAWEDNRGRSMSLGPCTHACDLAKVLRSQLQIGSALGIKTIWEVSHWAMS